MQPGGERRERGERERENEKESWPWRHILKQPNRNYSHLFFISFLTERRKNKAKVNVDGEMGEEVKLMHFQQLPERQQECHRLSSVCLYE